MRNLEDREIERGVESAATGCTVSGFQKALVRAYLEAVYHPESLVRVHNKREEAAAAIDILMQIDRVRGAIDWVRTSRRDLDKGTFAPFVIEFKNGSGIEIQ